MTEFAVGSGFWNCKLLVQDVIGRFPFGIMIVVVLDS